MSATDRFSNYLETAKSTGSLGDLNKARAAAKGIKDPETRYKAFLEILDFTEDPNDFQLASEVVMSTSEFWADIAAGELDQVVNWLREKGKW